MNKKGIYAPTLVILSVFLLAYAIFSFLGDDLAIAKMAGKNQIKLIEIYQKGEFVKQYIKQSARNSINKALYEFGQNGGLIKENCKKENYFIWNKDCKPSKEDFIIYFDKNFKTYLNSNEQISNIDYEYEIDNNNLILRSKKSILFDLSDDKVVLKEPKLIDFYIRETGYDHWIKEASQRFNVDENLIKAIITAEGSGPLDVSPKGAYGLMQIKEGAYLDVKRAFNIEWTFEDAKFNPRLNILTGTAYLKLQLDRFKDINLAVAAYNAGPTRVASLGKIPNIKETQNYVKKVSNELNKITGTAVLDIEKEAILTGTYELNPSFIEKIDFDFNILDQLYEEIKSSKDCLKNKDITSDLADCIKNKKEFQWKINKEGNFINFEVITNFKIIVNINKNLIQDNLIIKFKVDLENI